MNKNEFREKTYFDGGVFRWHSSNQIPPDDILIEVGVDEELLKVCVKTRTKELLAFLEDYRNQYQGPTEEERAEAHAAFGPGHTLVDVVTGHRWST